MPKIEIERERELPSSFKNRTIGLRGGGSMGRGGGLAPPNSVKMPYIGDAFSKSLTL